MTPEHQALNLNESAPRFWSKVDVRSPGKCWNWRASKDTDGYGHMSVGGKLIRSHKLALFIASDKMPAYACHTCDNRQCCNPGHVYAGDHARNMKDMADRLRTKIRRGELSPCAKTTNDDARKMRELYAAGDITISSIGLRFNVCKSTVQRIISGKAYV